jgi:Ran GTPase-activating protein 1
MPQNGIRPPGIEALANAFVQNQNLRIIDLNDNTITLAAPKLALAIEKLPKLEIINLESSLIRTKGAILIARAIVSHKNLQVYKSIFFLNIKFIISIIILKGIISRM